jgi:PIN domain nuclease of toxin-antitoxin system
VNLLVDTHLLLWATGEPQNLSRSARKLLDEPANALWFSAASLWEIVIKRALGREDFRVEPRRLRRGLLDNGWRELAVTSEHAVAVESLPPVHKDPFDCILLAQAATESFVLVTSDKVVARYPGSVRKV